MRSLFPRIFFPVLRYGAMVLLLAIASLRCNNNNVVDPLNENVKPEVISTYPQAGGVGPFSILPPNIYSRAPNFYIHFNKLMNKSTFTKKTVIVEGYDREAYALPAQTYSSDSYADVIAFYIYMKGPEYSSETPPAYKIGRAYTVTLDTMIADLNGNHLPNRYSFSFTPEPRFRVVDVSPAADDTAEGSYSGIQVRFNSPVDTASARRALSLQPALQGAWWSSNYGRWSTTYYFSSSNGEGLSSNTTYTILVDGNVKDTLGNTLGENYMSRFFSPQFRLRYWSSPYGLASQTYFTIGGNVDTTTIRQAISITPNTPYHFYLYSYGTGSFSIMPDSDWLPHTRYSIVVTPALHSSSGYALPDTFRGSFVTDSFRVSGHYPLSSGNRLNATISVDFNGRCDTATMRRAFHVSPETSGRLNFSGATDIAFTPDSLLKPFTVYTVTVDSTVRSIRGYKMARPFVYSFMTGGESGAGAP